MEQSAWLQKAFGDSAALHAMVDHSAQMVLMQPHDVSDFCKSCFSKSHSRLDVNRLQRLVTAVAHISLRQRMRIIFAGYRARFARIGAITAGNAWVSFLFLLGLLQRRDMLFVCHLWLQGT